VEIGELGFSHVRGFEERWRDGRAPVTPRFDSIGLKR